MRGESDYMRGPLRREPVKKTRGFSDTSLSRSTHLSKRSQRRTGPTKAGCAEKCGRSVRSGREAGRGKQAPGLKGARKEGLQRSIPWIPQRNDRGGRRRKPGRMAKGMRIRDAREWLASSPLYRTRRNRVTGHTASPLCTTGQAGKRPRAENMAFGSACEWRGETRPAVWGRRRGRGEKK
ncbi:hypothetical protein OF83DRAFT_701315 [Amylostereum chailletii]|nr:hypothetical protein OF83DRAFT_701315 [Amylostereum chailletii]